MKKKALVLIGVILTLLGFSFYFLFFDGGKVTDAERFSKEYTKIGEDNIFVYRTSSEIIKILENGTGVIYLGFPECPWCQAYVQYLQEVAKESGIEKIYYLNIAEDRKKDTANYKKIVSLLEDYLLKNDEGNPRVYVPDITIVQNGTILGHDNETSVVTKEDGTPEEYWTSERISIMKDRLKTMMTKLSENTCTTCGE